MARLTDVIPNLPRVEGASLELLRYVLPTDFEGALNLVFIAFEQHHQPDVDTWVPLARQLVARHMALRYYELPTIRRLNPLARTLIDGGMRAGIASAEARGATITLYLDKATFRRALDIADETDIRVMLVDRLGTIHWRSAGRWTPEKGQALAAAVAELLPG